jgi:hypothetical protein
VGVAFTELVPKLRFNEPVRNLPSHPAGHCAEEKMVLQFARVYREAFPRLHRGTTRMRAALARQIPVNGYGIADLVAVCWEPVSDDAGTPALDLETFLCEAQPVIRAFELKLRDWRKALKQAHRYRFFAHAAIVVLPPECCALARRFLDTFQALEVGLWSFDAVSGRITSYFTPRPRRPVDTRCQLKALRLVARASKALPIV